MWADRVCDAQVEAKYPALLFKQQLDAFVQKIFPMLRDNVKKEITPQLAACIHAPRAATTRGRRGGMAADVASPRAPNPLLSAFASFACEILLRFAAVQCFAGAMADTASLCVPLTLLVVPQQHRGSALCQQG